MNELLDRLEQYPVSITIALFVFGVIGFFLRRWFFKDRSTQPLIRAGGNISAGGDIIAGNKTVVNGQNRNLSSFESLIETEEWRKQIFDRGKKVWICEKDNTYQIEQGDAGEKFHEPWTQVYPDRESAYRYPVYLTIAGSRIKELQFISLDGGRIFVPMPAIKMENGMRVFFWNRNSLEFKVGRIIGEFYIHNSLEGIAVLSKISLV